MTKQKTIFIDGLPLINGHFSGVGQYVLGILKGFDELIAEQIASGNSQTKIKVIIPYDMVKKFKSFQFKHIRYAKYPLSFRVMASLWHRDMIPPLDLLYGRGVYIFSNFVSMPLLFNKSMIVIYDISFELFRQYSDEGNAIFLSKAVKKSVRSTNKIITISQNAKKEIVDFYGVTDDFVKVATPATDPHLFYRRSKNEIETVKNKYGIKGDYILALSNLEPRKNLGTLLEAYCDLPEKIRDTTSLLLVGVSGWKTDKLFDNIIEKVKDGYNITRPTEYVSDEDKPAILSGASILVYPSHYEGFGMPPLEALACGTPVITSNNSSLPEVVGKAGVMLDSNDVKGYTKTIEKYLSSTDASDKAILEGPDRSKLFSWKESARVYLDTARKL